MFYNVFKMTNIFDYATKELSQDAFIKWLISNYNIEDDLELRNISLSFVCFLTDGHVSVEELIKSKILIYSQVDHIDISIDIYPSKDSKLEDKHDVIVIEDKVFSSEHKQLTTYNKTINNWKNINRVFKVFYKVGSLSSNDLSGVDTANKDQSFKWRIYSLNKIYDFFKDKNKSNSQILNDYIEYINRIYKAYKGESAKSILEWKPYDFEGFIKKNLSGYDNEKSKKEEYVWIENYQGRYVSICYQRCLPCPYEKDAAVLEIFVRSKNKVSATFHHAFFIDKDSPRRWSIKKCPEKQELRDKLIEYIKELSKDSNSLVDKVRSNASNTFGRFVGEKKIDNSNDLLLTVQNWVDEFIKIVDAFKA